MAEKKITVDINLERGELRIKGALFLGGTVEVEFAGYEGASPCLVLFRRDRLRKELVGVARTVADDSGEEVVRTLSLNTVAARDAFGPATGAPAVPGARCPLEAYLIDSDGEPGDILARGVVAMQWSPVSFEADGTPVTMKGDPGAPGNPGEKGDDGLDAYQVAVRNGYTGTEAQWYTLIAEAASQSAAAAAAASQSAAAATAASHSAGMANASATAAERSAASAANARDTAIEQKIAAEELVAAEEQAREAEDQSLGRRISALESGKADKATTYTKSEVDTKFAGVQTFKKYLVQTLPDPNEADMKGLYLVPTGETSEEGDLCEEWTVVEDSGEKRWEKIGGTTVDLSDYYDKAAVDSLLDDKQDALPFDNAPTSGSNNPVKSGGIWSAIWGALSALPTGFTSLYDWCVNQLASKVPTSRKVNNKALSADISLTASDVGAATSAQGTKADSAIQTIRLGESAIVLSGTDVIFPIIEPTSDFTLLAAADAYKTWLMMQSYARFADTMRFSAKVSYAVGDVVFYNGAFYRCTTAHTAGAWNALHFAEVLGLSTVVNNVVYPTAQTPTSGDDSTKVATTAFVKTAVEGATPNLDYVMRVDPETGGIYYTTPDTNA